MTQPKHYPPIGLHSIALAIALTACASVACAAEPFLAEGVQVLDGDTIRVEKLHLGWGVALTDVTIRAADYDAWESSKARRSVVVTDAEVRKGKIAAAALVEEIKAHPKVIVMPVGRARDNYGRLLGIIYTESSKKERWSVAAFMQMNGHCRTEAKP